MRWHTKTFVFRIRLLLCCVCVCVREAWAGKVFDTWVKAVCCSLVQHVPRYPYFISIFNNLSKGISLQITLIQQELHKNLLVFTQSNILPSISRLRTHSFSFYDCLLLSMSPSSFIRRTTHVFVCCSTMILMMCHVKKNSFESMYTTRLHDCAVCAWCTAHATEISSI